MKKSEGSKAKKWLKVGAWVVGLSLLFFIGLYVFTGWLQQKLEKSVAEQTDGVYKLQLYGLETSPFIGGVSLDSINLKPDYKRWEQLQSQGQKVSRTLVALQLGEIELRGLSFFNMLFKQTVTLDQLRVQRPVLMMTAMRRDTTQQHKPMHQTVKGLLQGMKVGSIQVINADFRYREAKKEIVNIFSLSNFDVTVSDYQLDSASFHNPDRAYYAGRINLKARKAVYEIPNDYYRLTTDSLVMDTEKRMATVRQIVFKPSVDAAALAKAKGKAVTYLELKVAGVLINGLNYGEHSRNNNFLANRIEVNKPDIFAFKDKKNFTEAGSQPLPHEIAQSIKTYFTIDTVNVKNGHTRYEELAPKGTKRGYMFLSALNGSITNLSNNPKHISRDKPAVISANAQLMGKVGMQATVRIPLLDKDGFHTLKGSVRAGQPQVLNPILVPTNFIKIDKGYVREVNFNATLNQNNANGTMVALYDNLEIELLSPGTGGDQSLGKKIISKAADWLLIENSNPDSKGEKPRVGNINVTRNKQRSVITYWKDCVASGLMASMGMQQMANKKF